MADVNLELFPPISNEVHLQHVQTDTFFNPIAEPMPESSAPAVRPVWVSDYVDSFYPGAGDLPVKERI